MGWTEDSPTQAPTQAADLDVVEYSYNASYSDTDLAEFRTAFNARLTTAGVDVSVLSVSFREGSIIVSVAGPSTLVQKISGLDVSQLAVMGYMPTLLVQGGALAASTQASLSQLVAQDGAFAASTDPPTPNPTPGSVGQVEATATQASTSSRPGAVADDEEEELLRREEEERRSFRHVEAELVVSRTENKVQAIMAEICAATSQAEKTRLRKKKIELESDPEYVNATRYLN